ncbi:MAG: hypothetical protein CMH55_05970 [Myxococcales bacterium]|nr:hypothetical protein [Myxococcales bacterium]
MNRKLQAEFVIVGAGLAGAAVAEQLTKAGHRDLLVIEQESEAGWHGSGQNAGMLRQHASNPFTAALARRGLHLHRSLRDRLPAAPPLLATGSVLVGGQGPELAAGYRAGHTERLPAARFEELTGMQLPAQSRALYCPDDGLREAKALCHHLLEHSAATLQMEARVEGLHHQGGRVRGLVLEDGRSIEAERVILCGGAWSRDLLDLPLQPFKRHLFVLSQRQKRTSMPWVWDLDGEVYFRGHEEGLLVSACDDIPESPRRGEQPACGPEGLARLHRALHERWPQLAAPRLVRSWAGLRVLSPDDAFILGPDPRFTGLAWCTGLGGHGLTCALSAAALALRPWLGDQVDVGNDPQGPDLNTLQQAHSLERLPFTKEIWDA